MIPESVLGRRELFSNYLVPAGTLAMLAPAWQGLARVPDQPDPTLVRDPNRILDLANGFSYKVLQRVGDKMSDGFRVGGLPDGMGAFDLGGGRVALMRNHEMDKEDWEMSPISRRASVPKYSKKVCGGVSRLVWDSGSGSVLSSNQVLFGTERNCAGGYSPWGWLSCEETVNRGHGYVFLCDPRADSLQEPFPIKAYGRFNHEAAVVDDRTLIAYMTEDRADGCFYRFVPRSRSEPFEGQLQALKIRGEQKFPTMAGLDVGVGLDVEWVTVPDSDPKKDTVRYQAQEKGAAIFARGEGICSDGAKVYFACTSGGPHQAGQIFSLDIASQSGRLELVYQSPGRRTLNMPDNITVAKWGDIYMAEDNYSSTPCRIVVLSPSGQTRTLAENVLSASEFAGVCFAPDGETLFANMQGDGLTVAINGPFRRFLPQA